MPVKHIDTGTTAGVGGVLFTDRRQFYIEPNTYAELWTAITPFLSTVMIKGETRSGLADPMFKLFEHRNPWEKEQVQINGTVATVGNDDNTDALTVDNIVGLSSGLTSAADGSYLGLAFEVWDSTKTTKKGVVVVTATAANTLTVKNLSTTSFNTADDDYMVCIGHWSGQNQTAPQGWADELSVVWNACGIMRTAVEIDGTLYQAALRGYSKELERLRKQKFEVHKLRTERMLLRSMSVLGTNMNGSGTFADNWRTDADGQKIRTTMGLIPAIEAYGVSTDAENQNIFDFTGGLTFNQWVDATEKIWQYLPESGVKDFFCGPRALSYWSKIDNQGRMRTGFPIQLSEFKQDNLGVYFKYLETPFGLSRLIYTPSLKREYANYMISVTPENIFRAVYRPTVYKTNIKTDDGYDGIKDEYMSDEGVGISLIESHSIVKTPTT